MLRDWHSMGGQRRATQALSIRKEESNNTPPNHFFKFALNHFRKISQDIVDQYGDSETISTEAIALRDTIDATLAQPFFRELSRLQHLPLNNQTLQKREGYRDFLRGWILVESANSLNWEGQRDCFEGTTRDVATLYEYWLFLEIHKVLESFEGMRILTDSTLSGDADCFLNDHNGSIKLNLQRGKNSLSSFEFLPPGATEALRIDLHYEKTFCEDTIATSGGSYSKQFRPDYTLALFPSHYQTEANAAKEGKVAHLHFDAKYRANALKEMFGETSTKSKETPTRTRPNYKRDDLLKMHTYNDALRKTIGSYVLYPGDGTETITEFKKFHEIAPSVGALVMKPGNPICQETLKAFLSDVFEHQLSQFTQFSYLRDSNNSIIENKPRELKEEEVTYQVARQKAPCILLWMKPANVEQFKAHGFAYCRAIPEDANKEINLNLSIEAGSEFVPIGGASYKLNTHGWRAKTTSVRLISKTKLLQYITSVHPTCSIKPSSSTKYYVLIEFSKSSDFPAVDVTELHKRHRLGNSQYIAVSPSYEELLDCDLVTKDNQS